MQNPKLQTWKCCKIHSIWKWPTIVIKQRIHFNPRIFKNLPYITTYIKSRKIWDIYSLSSNSSTKPPLHLYKSNVHLRISDTTPLPYQLIFYTAFIQKSKIYHWLLDKNRQLHKSVTGRGMFPFLYIKCHIYHIPHIKMQEKK